MGTTENKKQEQPIQRIDIVAFANLLRKRSPAVARFKIDRYTQDVPAMLRDVTVSKLKTGAILTKKTKRQGSILQWRRVGSLAKA